MQLNELTNRALRPLTRVRPLRNRPVFLLGHDRSGSTWIGRTLGLAQEVIYLHEPLNSQASQLGDWDCYNLHLSEGARHDVCERIFGQAVEGIGVRNLSRREIKMRLLGQPTVVIKETGGMMNGEWFERLYRGRVALLVRHPVPLILSNIKMGEQNADFWLARLREQNAMLETYCSDVDLDRILGPDPDVFAKFAVIYCVRYRVALGQRDRHPDWLLLRYEDFCENPVDRFRELYEALGLTFSDPIRESIRQSCSQDGSDSFFGTKRISKDMADSWRSKISAEDAATVRQVVEAFDFPDYRDAGDWL